MMTDVWQRALIIRSYEMVQICSMDPRASKHGEVPACGVLLVSGLN